MFLSNINITGSILAIDYGIKRLGLAVSDPMRKFALPLGVIDNKNTSFVLEEIEKLIQEKNVDLIIVGMPLNMDGSESKMSLLVEKFLEHINKKLNIKVETVDERLSSFAAEENLKERDFNSKKIKRYVDTEAARLMLEEYISVKLNN